MLEVSVINASNTDNNEYIVIMGKVLQRMDSAKNTVEFQQCRNQFERISQKYDNEWLPLYYTVYCNLEMVYHNPKSEQNNAILADSKKILETLNTYKDTDISELNTLWGYYYTAIIMLDPQVNGQKYFNEVISSYEKAMKQNTENPRPIFLLALFEENLPDFIRSKRDYCEEMNKTKELFVKQEKTIYKPYWGENFFTKISAKCYK